MKTKLKSDAVFAWPGKFVLSDIQRANPAYVQFAVLSDFLVGPQTKEIMWAKVIRVKPHGGLDCVVDNLPDFTISHGLKADDAIQLEAGNVLEMR